MEIHSDKFYRRQKRRADLTEGNEENKGGIRRGLLSAARIMMDDWIGGLVDCWIAGLVRRWSMKNPIYSLRSPGGAGKCGMVCLSETQGAARGLALPWATIRPPLRGFETAACGWVLDSSNESDAANQASGNVYYSLSL